MAQLKIITYPDPRLKQVSLPVEDFAWETEEIVKNMLDTMYHGRGVGLAAVQVGILKRILVVDVSDNGQAPQVFINPEIIATEGEDLLEEGCLSFPGVYARVTRPLELRVRYYDLKGYIKELDTDGLLAHCLHHEMDHLQGITFFDKVSKLKQDLMLKKLAKYQAIKNP